MTARRCCTGFSFVQSSGCDWCERSLSTAVPLRRCAGGDGSRVGTDMSSEARVGGRGGVARPPDGERSKRLRSGLVRASAAVPSRHRQVLAPSWLGSPLGAPAHDQLAGTLEAVGPVEARQLAVDLLPGLVTFGG